MLPDKVAEEDNCKVVVGTDEAAEESYELGYAHVYEDGKAEDVDFVAC